MIGVETRRDIARGLCPGFPCRNDNNNNDDDDNNNIIIIIITILIIIVITIVCMGVCAGVIAFGCEKVGDDDDGVHSFHCVGKPCWCR